MKNEKVNFYTARVPRANNRFLFTPNMKTNVWQTLRNVFIAVSAIPTDINYLFQNCLAFLYDNCHDNQSFTLIKIYTGNLKPVILPKLFIYVLIN